MVCMGDYAACGSQEFVVSMKFTITKEDFLEGLQQVQHVVSSRTTLPILSNVLLEADGNSLRLTTTDLDVGVTGSVKAKV